MAVTNAELKAQLQALQELVGSLAEQVKATNGRVTNLEKAKSFRDGVRAGYTWVPPMLTALAGGAIYYVLLILHHP